MGLAMDLAWTDGDSEARFAAVRVRPAQGDARRGEARPEEWLLIEWPPEAKEPTNFWLSTLPEETPMADLVDTAHQALADRAGCSGPPTRTGTRSRQRAGMARSPSPRGSVHRRPWFPGRRAGGFPLPPRRPCNPDRPGPCRFRRSGPTEPRRQGRNGTFPTRSRP